MPEKSKSKKSESKKSESKKPESKKLENKKPDNKKFEKKVKFEKEENINIIQKEHVPFRNGLKLDEDESEKEKELETEIEETEQDEQEEQEEENILDEDNEINDEIEYDDGQDLDDNEIDDLYDDEDGIKSKKKVNKKKKKVDEDSEQLPEDNEDCEYNYNEIYDEKKEEPSVIVENSERITLPKLTKYEKVRLIGTRAKQLSLGAKVMIKNTSGLNPIEIAKLELQHKMIPMKIKRVLPDNKIEIWKLSELDIDN